MAAAKKGRLGELHAKFTELLLMELQMYNGELVDADGKTIPAMPMAAADKSVIVAFLKANNITADPDAEGMTKLTEAFAEDIETRRKARAAILTETTTDELSRLIN